MCRALDYMQQQPSSYRNPACYSHVLRLPLRVESEQPDKESIREGLPVWGKRSLHLAREEGECGWYVGFAMVLTRTVLSYEDTERYTVLHHSRKAYVGQMETVSRST